MLDEIRCLILILHSSFSADILLQMFAPPPNLTPTSRPPQPPHRRQHSRTTAMSSSTRRPTVAIRSLLAGLLMWLQLGCSALPPIIRIGTGAFQFVMSLMGGQLIFVTFCVSAAAIFTDEQRDGAAELAFKYAVYRINKDKSILPASTLIYDIQYVPQDDSFRTTKKGITTLEPYFERYGITSQLEGIAYVITVFHSERMNIIPWLL